MSTARMLPAVAMTALCLLLAGCPDDEGGGFCDSFEFQACGGDVVGEWTLLDVCPSSSTSSSQPVSDDVAACSDDLIRITYSFSTMTASFRADGTYSMSRAYTSSGTVEIDQDCSDGMTGGQATLEMVCTEVEQELQAGYGVGATCTVTDAVCRCNFTDAGSDSESGTYTVAGTQLTTTPTSGFPETVAFCIEGDQVSVQLSQPIGDQDATWIIMTR